MTLSASILFLVVLGMTIHALVGRSMNMQGVAAPKDKASRIRGIFDRAKGELARLRKERLELVASVAAKADAIRLAAAKKDIDEAI